jgi:hypothetical protein
VECWLYGRLAQEAGIGLPFSDKKIIPRNTKQDGTDGSSVGIPSVSRKRKTSEICSEPFLGREKAFYSKPFSMIKPWNSFPNHFQKRKLWNSVPNHFRKKKQLGIPFQTIFGRENTSKSVPNHFGTENTRKTMTFDSCFVKLHYFREIPFRSVWFRTTKLTLSMNTEFCGMSTFFRGITETVPSLFRGIFSERNFDGNPKQEVIPALPSPRPRHTKPKKLLFNQPKDHQTFCDW